MPSSGTTEELEIIVANVGVYCFDVEVLRRAAPAERRQRLGRVPAHRRGAGPHRGRRVETVWAESIEEILGIIDRADLELAEQLKDSPARKASS